MEREVGGGSGWGTHVNPWLFHFNVWQNSLQIKKKERKKYSIVCCDPYKGFSTVNETKVDAFLEFPCFFYDSVFVGNLISGSSAFSKSSLNIWKFLIHVLLKPSLKDFEHNLTGMWNKCNCMVIWTFFGLASLWDWDENWPFPVLWPFSVLLFSKLAGINECSTLTESS